LTNSIYPEAQRGEVPSLSDYLTQMADLLDRIENHLYNVGALPANPPAEAKLTQVPSILTRLETALARVGAIEDATSKIAATLGGQLGGKKCHRKP